MITNEVNVPVSPVTELNDFCPSPVPFTLTDNCPVKLLYEFDTKFVCTVPDSYLLRVLEV